MLRIEGSAQLHKIVVLNPKGGSGKTTLAFNLAGYLAQQKGRKVALVDMDSQASSMHWLSNRPAELPHIHGIAAQKTKDLSRHDFRVTVPEHIDYVVIDAPASLARHELSDYTRGAHAILVPVLPSVLDIHAAASLISKLLLNAQVSRRNRRLAVVANRVNQRTIAYRQLMRFLSRLSIAVVGVLRDSQNYIRAAAQGICIHEMPPSRVSKDLDQWQSVTQWLETCLAKPLTPRDLLRPAVSESAPETRWWQKPLLAPTAAMLAALLISIAVWTGTGTRTTAAPSAAAAPVVDDTAAQAAQPRPAESLPALEADSVDQAVQLKQKWKLSGVAQAGHSSVVFLEDRANRTTRRVTEDSAVDGWLVSAAGDDYVILAQNGEEIRLELNEKAAP
jgi:chromosome partitioning protein